MRSGRGSPMPFERRQQHLPPLTYGTLPFPMTLSYNGYSYTSGPIAPGMPRFQQVPDERGRPFERSPSQARYERYERRPASPGTLASENRHPYATPGEFDDLTPSDEKRRGYHRPENHFPEYLRARNEPLPPSPSASRMSSPAGSRFGTPRASSPAASASISSSSFSPRGRAPPSRASSPGRIPSAPPTAPRNATPAARAPSSSRSGAPRPLSRNGGRAVGSSNPPSQPQTQCHFLRFQLHTRRFAYSWLLIRHLGKENDNEFRKLCEKLPYIEKQMTEAYLEICNDEDIDPFRYSDRFLAHNGKEYFLKNRWYLDGIPF